MANIFKGLLACWRWVSIRLLRLFNYNCINNMKGTSHPILNSFDIVLAIAYLVLSLVNLGEATPLVLFINLITAFKLIIKDLRASLNLRARHNKLVGENMGYLYKSPHFLKLIIESTIMILFLIFFAFRGESPCEYVIHNFAVTVIWITFAEHLFNAIIGFFEADVELAKIDFVLR